MFGISLDESHDRPVGTTATRRACAIHWNWTTEATESEIADALGVTARTVRNYLNEGPTDDVKQAMDHIESEVRMVAVAELRAQLRAAGDRSKSAEKPVKIYENENGELEVDDIELEGGGTKKVPVVQDMKLMPDEQARYYARGEVREIIDQLTSLTGAGEPEEVSVDHSGSLFDLPPEVTDKWDRIDGDDG